MGNTACASCIKSRKKPEGEAPQPSDNDNNNGISEDDIVVLDNRDGYFSREDIATILKKYPEYLEWQKISKETTIEPKRKEKKIKWKEAELIGHGSFGRVVLGLNRSTGELMAVKQVYLGGLNSNIIDDKIQALEVELDLLSEFSHKNIVRYIGTSKTKDSFNIFLEYISGGTIASLVGKYGPFNETIIKIYIKQILEGLEYLHARNVIHRDIKGANVLVDNTGVCKLADFGSAKRIKNLLEGEALNSLKGTADWMAPEVIMQKNLSRFADIWSIGCVILEMATGRPPWASGNQMATMFQIAKTRTPPPFPPGLSSDCVDFLKQCFKINPKERANVTTLLKHKFLKDVEILSKDEKNILPNQSRNQQGRLSVDKLKNGLEMGDSQGITTINGTATGSLLEESKSPKPRLSRQYLLSQHKKNFEMGGGFAALTKSERKSSAENQSELSKERHTDHSKFALADQEKITSPTNNAALLSAYHQSDLSSIDNSKNILQVEAGPTVESKEVLSHNDIIDVKRTSPEPVIDTGAIDFENIEAIDQEVVGEQEKLNGTSTNNNETVDQSGFHHEKRKEEELLDASLEPLEQYPMNNESGLEAGNSRKMVNA